MDRMDRSSEFKSDRNHRFLFDSPFGKQATKSILLKELL